MSRKYIDYLSYIYLYWSYLCILSNHSVVQCPPIPTWQGMEVNTSSRDFNTNIAYGCEGNYSLLSGKTSATSFCNVWGIWDPSIELCQGNITLLFVFYLIGHISNPYANQCTKANCIILLSCTIQGNIWLAGDIKYYKIHYINIYILDALYRCHF